MTMTTEEPEGSRALTALTELYRDTAEPSTAAQLDRGLDAILAHASGKKRRRGLLRWSLMGATVGVSALVLLQLASVYRTRLPTPGAPTLTYKIDGGSVIEGGYLRESGHDGMNVRFNEGSTFALAPGTRGRIRVVDRDGARVAIEHGTASFQVTHGGGRLWLVDVGPFLVTVKGTVFTVSWDPLSERFELGLRRGSVVVSGPVSAGEMALRAGQRLVVDLAKVETTITETTITEEKPEQPSGDTAGVPTLPGMTAPDLQPSLVPRQPSGAGPSLAPIPSNVAKSVVDRGWSADVARGHWDRILQDVKRLGVEATLSRASSDDLFALADAARYRRRPDLARAALLAERRRFPDSPRTHDAIYLLGRVEESRESGTAQAIARYDEYLARAPAGPFVGEALGRKMTLTDKLEGPARARPIAEDYLRRFPKGNYAGSARELIRAP
jgi:ferric-dicitrate binding protein FerR (iron transport regulator)